MIGHSTFRWFLAPAIGLAMVLAAAVVVPAEAAAQPVVRTSLAVPFRGEYFTVTSAIPTRVRRPVELQRVSGGRWVRVLRSVTSSSGLASFRIRTSSSSLVLRVWAPAYRTGGRTYAGQISTARNVVTAVQAVTLGVARDSGGRVDATATASQARVGRTVYLQSLAPGGAWRTVTSKRMTSSRTTSFADAMTVSAARGLRLRAYLGAFNGAPGTASAQFLPPGITVQTTTSGESTVVSAVTTGPVSKVRFFVDGVQLSEDTAAPFRATWPSRVGSHDVMARAFGPLQSTLSPAKDVLVPETTVGSDSGVAEGFSLETVQTGFDLPTSAAAASTGQVFVAEKAGLVRTITPDDETGWSLPRTVLDLRNLVIDVDDSGLIGIAVDPEFAENGYVYLSYVLKDPGDDGQRQTQQVVRYTWNGNQLAPASRHVVLGSVTGAACSAQANLRTPDCIPIFGRAHTIGDLGFDDAGHLLVGIGDGSLYVTPSGLADRYEAIRAQDPEILAGKILRIDPVTGRGVPGNPLYTGSGTSNASRVIALGLRNPFRFSVRDDQLVLGDVGDGAFEELDVVPLSGTGSSAPNYGWPCLEGDTLTSLPGLEQSDSPWHPCVAVRGAEANEPPAYVYPHSSGGGSVTGGVFMDSDSYPESVRGRYLFGDYAQNFIRTADVSEGGEVSGVARLANSTAADGPVKFLTGPDGLVWVLSIYSGSLRRVRYTGEGVVDRCPEGSFRRSFHDLDGPDSVFDQEFPDDEWRWLYPYTAAQLPAEELGAATCEPGVHLGPTTGSPWATTGSPDTRAHPGDRFGTAWRGRVNTSPGTYRFTVRGSEWVRLWVDDELVHDFYSNDFWPLESTRQHDVVLGPGQHNIRAELVHGDQSSAAADVTWTRVGGPPVVKVTAPANGTVASAGKVPWAVTVSDPDGDSQADLKAKVVLSVDFLHYGEGHYHGHPVSRVTGQLSGTALVNDDHAPGAGAVRLRASVTDASGAQTTSTPVYVCFPNGKVGPCDD